MKDIDTSNTEFANAVEFVLNTNKSIFLTGKAGSGKTTFLKYIQRKSTKNKIVLAPTGVAAINAGGSTINSFFQIPFGPFLPNDERLTTNPRGSEDKESIYTTFKYGENKRKIINSLELLIIDELSMVRADTLDVIDKILKVFRRKPYLPFGGVQILLIGDPYQLSPVVKEQEGLILSEFYSSEFFFASQAWSELDPIHIELKKIYRQKDQEFIDILNRIRKNELFPSDIELLNSKLDPSFNGFQEGYITLSTHRSKVDQINASNLDKLEGEEFQFEALVKGNFPDGAKPTEHILTLKEGAQVMFVKNDSSEMKEFYNGKLGVVSSIDGEVVKVLDDENNEIELTKALWENYQYTYNKEKGRVEQVQQGSFEQFPVKLAWAITVHKSQGLTFDKAIVDLAGSFTSGQVYVALSRCTSFDHLVLKSGITENSIKVAPKVLEFGNNQTSQNEIIAKMNDGKADQLYLKARKHFENTEFELAFDSFKQAMKIRNDIEEPGLKRYLSIYYKRLFFYRDKFNSINSNINSESTLKTNLGNKLKNDFNFSDKNIDPNLIDVTKMLEEANLKILNYNYTGAIIDLNFILETNTNIEKAYLYRASCFRGLGNYKDAILDYDKALELNSKNDFALYCRADCKRLLKNYDGSIRDLDQAIRINSKNFFYLKDRAYCRFKIEDIQGSLIDYDRVVEINPNDDSTFFMRGECKSILGRFDNAIDDYDKAISINSNNSKYYEKRGSIKFKIKNYKEAITDFDKSILLNSKEVFVFWEKAICHFNLKEYDEAICSFDKVIEKKPKNINSYLNRGICWENLKNFELAIRNYDFLIDMDSNHELGFYRRAICYGALGYYKNAIRDLLKVLELNPKNQEAELNLIKWQAFL